MKLFLVTPFFLCPSLLLDALPFALAIRFPLEGRIGSFSQQGSLPLARNMGRIGHRASMMGTLDLSNDRNVQYQANITMSGQQFNVVIDTGSSDLTVTGTVPGAKDTSKTAEVTYDVGTTQGPIKTATLEFGGYTVEDLAFIEQPVDSTHQEGGGIMGLGPGNSSEVRYVLGQGAGDTVLDRIFRQNTTTPNFITILLGRAGDPSDTFTGDLTIGEVVQPFGNITQQPKLPVTQTALRGGQHWTALLDPNGIVGPDGQRINTTKTTSGNRYNVVFDSGYSFPQVPKDIADAIYGRVPGATLTTVKGIAGDVWVLPCTTELNVTFVFSGVQFPIHPLDTVTNAQGLFDKHGNPTCFGAFQPYPFDAVGFDIILGMSFLRNAYILINFGDFVDGAPAKVGDPYVQLLPLTNPAEAHADFVKVRLDGANGGLQKYLLPIILCSVLGGLILLWLVAYALCGRSSKKYCRLHNPAQAGLPRSLANS